MKLLLIKSLYHLSYLFSDLSCFIAECSLKLDNDEEFYTKEERGDN